MRSVVRRLARIRGFLRLPLISVASLARKGVEAGQVDSSTLLALSQENNAEELFTSPVPNGMGFNRLLFIGRFRREMARFM